MYIGKGGALNKSFRLIKQLIRVLGAYQRDISGSELRLRDVVQIYVRPWWHYSCDLHFKPVTVAPDFKQAILHRFR